MLQCGGPRVKKWIRVLRVYIRAISAHRGLLPHFLASAESAQSDRMYDTYILQYIHKGRVYIHTCTYVMCNVLCMYVPRARECNLKRTPLPIILPLYLTSLLLSPPSDQGAPWRGYSIERFSLVGKLHAAKLSRHHPRAGIRVSSQSFCSCITPTAVAHDTQLQAPSISLQWRH